MQNSRISNRRVRKMKKKYTILASNRPVQALLNRFILSTAQMRISLYAHIFLSGNWLRETFNVAPVTESVKVQTLRIGLMSTQPSNARHAAHVLEKPADRCCPHTKDGRNSRLHLSNLIYTPSGNSSRHISVTGCASPLSEMRLLSRGEDHAHGYVKQDHGWQSARVGNTGHGEHALVLAMVGARKRPNTQLVGARKRPNTQ
jgi:hypothetical protein